MVKAMPKATTPASIKSVRPFIASAGLSGKPKYLPFRFVSDKYRAGYCLDNCTAEAKRTGDPVEYGWIIWQNQESGFIEAEFHAVMRRQNGLDDITPRPDREDNILFLIDASRIPEFQPPATWATWANIKYSNGFIIENTRRILIEDTAPRSTFL
jgi:hypothetical protein